jgi:hypothetical protein
MSTTDDQTGPIKKLLSSSKGLMVLAIIGLSYAALFAGKATWAQITELLKYVIGPWLAAVGIEDAARHVAGGLRDRGRSEAVEVPEAKVRQAKSGEGEGTP